MITRPLLQGELVRLIAINPELEAEQEAKWSLDSEYTRLLDSDPTRPTLVKKFRERMEKSEGRDAEFSFAIHTLDDDRSIGSIGFDGIQWTHGHTFVGVGIGDREYWGKGYGTDAMREILRFAFTELNLHRVSLNVFEYNPRAIHSYEKAGFVYEGRMRGFLERDGRRWDLIYMGILKDEWEKLNS